jgi:DNA (cytosine-5)-methyltransferase 1
MRRIIGEVRPGFVVVENSPALSFRGAGRVVSDLAEMGYVGRNGCLGADAAGLTHHRTRMWMVANSTSGSDQSNQRVQGKVGVESSSERQTNPPAVFFPYKLREPIDGDFTYRKDDGLAGGMDRLKAIGNGQVPQVVAAVWRKLSESL